ncbi:Amino-acid acetyltransferase, mitochondrial, partial [Frankliniella fusca]
MVSACQREFLPAASAQKFCRLCLLSLTELKESSNSIGPLRTSATHKQHVEDVVRDPSLKKTVWQSALASVLRVPEDSVMDAFHDFVGVSQMVLKLVLYEFIIVKKLFTVSYFNANIVAFAYGKPEITNKPSANLTEEKVVIIQDSRYCMINRGSNITMLTDCMCSTCSIKSQGKPEQQGKEGKSRAQAADVQDLNVEPG